MALTTNSIKNTAIRSDAIASLSDKKDINIVVEADSTGSGTLAVWVKVGQSQWIDISQSVDIATELNTIKSITAGPYDELKLVPAPLAGKTETQTDFVFAAAGKTITTIAGDFIGFASGDIITVVGTTNNNGTYTINGAPTTTVITVTEVLVDETPAVSMTVDSFGTITQYSTFIAAS